MKKLNKIGLGLFLTAAMGLFTGCSEFDPETPALPELYPVSNLQATPAGRTIMLTWDLPNAADISGVQITVNGNNDNPIQEQGAVTSYAVMRQPMEQENLYTVKVMYKGGYMSDGESVYALLPYQDMPQASNVNATYDKRTVTLTWDLPSTTGITGVNVLCNGILETSLPATATSCVLKSQEMETPLQYGIEIVYDDYYTSSAEGQAQSSTITIPYFPSDMGFLLLAADWMDLEDDDERAAAAWFEQQENAQFISVDQLATLDPEEVSVLWIMVDRVGLEQGWQNLPGGLADATTISALQQYSANGGSIYLAKMAAQLVEPLGVVPDGMGPNIYANGAGGSHGDIWTINPYLGWMFQPNGSQAQGFYDRTDHAIYQGLTFEQVNDYPYPSLPLLGPGDMEDHNIMWDLNVNPPFGPGNQPDVIRNFEVTTNSLVLATWGHVQDHCVAGLVLFNSNSEHGRYVVNGFAAYEFFMNSGENPYQGNIEGLTLNILNYLK